MKKHIKGRFVKGKSGNPSGRPKGSVSITSVIKKYLKDHPEKLTELMKFYLNDKKMRDLLWKMIDGLPKQKVEAEIEGKLPFMIKIVKDDKTKGKDS